MTTNPFHELNEFIKQVMNEESARHSALLAHAEWGIKPESRPPEEAIEHCQGRERALKSLVDRCLAAGPRTGYRMETVERRVNAAAKVCWEALWWELNLGFKGVMVWTNPDLVLRFNEAAERVSKLAIALAGNGGLSPAGVEANDSSLRPAGPSEGPEDLGPIGDPPASFMSAADIVKHLGQPEARVESALRRFRLQNPDCYSTAEDARKNQPRYLYDTGRVWPHLAKWVRRWKDRDGATRGRRS